MFERLFEGFDRNDLDQRAREDARLNIYEPDAYVLATLGPPTAAVAGDPPAVFAQRGYYFTLCRMPTYGLDAWKQIMDGTWKRKK